MARPKATHTFESALIIVALVSLWPMLLGYERTWWYRVWLVLMLGAMVWVASRRLARTRAAAAESKRLRDETEKTGRPPVLKD
jgi:hypothetical protein